MKRILLFIAILFIPMMIIGCTEEDTNGDEDIISDNLEDNTEEDVNVAPDIDNNEDKMRDLNYTKFELEVDYGEDKEYEAEIKLDKDNLVKAKLEDDFKNIDLKGEEAFNEIYPKVEKLTIEQQTTKEDAIEEVIDIFTLDADYIKLELEITFKDGTKIEYIDSE